MLFEPALITRRFWFALLAGVCIAYVLLLAFILYGSQSKLQVEAEQRLLAENQQLAAVLADVILERKNFIDYLSESNEIETYFVNKALGVSFNYGLNINISAIEDKFRRKMVSTTLLGSPVYKRILFFNSNSEILADTAPELPLPALPNGFDLVPKLIVDNKSASIIMTKPIFSSDTLAGVVMTVSEVQPLSNYLPSRSANVKSRQLLVTEQGEIPVLNTPLTFLSGSSVALAQLPANKIIALDTLPQLQKSIKDLNFNFALRVPVKGSPFSLVILFNDAIVYGPIASRLLFYAASIIPILLILGLIWFFYMRQRNHNLQLQMFEANRHRQELLDRNNLLKSEIIQREALEVELRSSEERYRTYIEHAPEGIFVVNKEAILIDVNPSVCQMLGFERQEMLLINITDFSPPEFKSDLGNFFAKVLASAVQEAEFTLIKKNGSEILVYIRTIALPNKLIMVFCVDVTNRKHAEEKIRQLAFFDPLTLLPNRRLLLDRLNQAMLNNTREKEYGALLMLDLDNFKNLNDTQGHDIGDRLLIEVANRLSFNLRQQDTVSRFGGDEFVVIFERLGSDESVALRQAELISLKLHLALNEPYNLMEGKAPYYNGCSIGVALFLGQNISTDLLIKQADVALYQAKNAGRNAIRFFNPAMQEKIDSRSKMESDLRRGLVQNEFQLYFQPQVDVTGRVTGAEVLLRWLPENLLSVSPAHFIPVAEETGLILPLGMWVLEQACAQLKKWENNPNTRHLVLAVNVSSKQLHQADFVEQVLALLDESAINPALLKLEITEGVLLERVDEVIHRMTQLKIYGIRFSLDDFGTGYSSLSYLKRLPLDQVKIDQSFVRDITIDQNDAAIVRAIIAMSESLGLEVIAEGVETKEQKQFLDLYGCKNFQGYLFGRPTPIHSWPEFVVCSLD